jgi:hypothetical protein
LDLPLAKVLNRLRDRHQKDPHQKPVKQCVVVVASRPSRKAFLLVVAYCSQLPAVQLDASEMGLEFLPPRPKSCQKRFQTRLM